MMIKRGKQPPPGSKETEVPTEGIVPLAIFKELNRCRGSNGFGLSSISFQEIYAWEQVCDFKLSMWQLDAVLKMDQIYLSMINKLKEQEDGSRHT